MGEYADDIVNGACCEDCGVYFEVEHGYPVYCKSCYKQLSKEEKILANRARWKELGDDMD